MKLRSKTCCLGFTLLALATPALAPAAMKLEAGSITAAPGATVELPVSIIDAADLGSLQFDLKYDPALLTPAEAPVKAGPFLPGAMFEANPAEPGLLRVALISGNAVSGTGEILLVAFDVPADVQGSTSLTLDQVRAWDHSNNLEMLIESSAGTATIATKSDLLLWVAIAAATLLVLAVLIARTRRTRPSPSA